jgi:type IV pili sensor histidine kinase/response regulator
MKLLLAIMIILMLITLTGTTFASVSVPEVVRYDRYLLVNTTPGQPPLTQTVTLSIPPGFHPDTGETLQYLLRDSGYSLCLPDTSRARLYGFPMPLSQYRVGPVRLEAALQMLAGNAWHLVVNDLRREICFEPKSDTHANDPLLPAVMHRRPLSHPVLGPATAPFFLAGVIQRGDMRLAVLVPPDALWLNQVVWLRAGEQWQGWRLEKLDDQRAVFRHGKRHLTQAIPE